MAISLLLPPDAVAPTGNVATADLGSQPTAGSTLLAFGHWNVASIAPTPTGWTLLRSEIAPTNGHAIALYGKTATGSGEQTVTLTHASATRSRLHYLAYGGLETNVANLVADVKSKEDTSQIANHQFTNANSLRVANPDDPEALVIAFVALHNNGASNNDWSNSYTQQSTLNGGGAFPASHLAHKILSSSGTHETTMTTSNSRFPIYMHVVLRAPATGGDTEVDPNDVSLGLSIDSTTISQTHIVQAQDAGISLSIDNTTITQNHIIEPDDISLGLTLDNTTVDVNYTVEPDDIGIGLTLDSTTIEQGHVVEPHGIDLSLFTGNTTVAQVHGLDTDDIALGLSLDATTIEVGAITVVPDDLSLGLSVDAATIAQNHVVAPDDVSLGLTADNTSITQNHVLSPADIALGLSLDSTNVDVSSILIEPDDVAIGVSLAGTTIAQGHVISPQDIGFALTLDNATISQNHVLVPSDIGLGLSVDSTTVAETNFNIVPQDVLLGLGLDSTTIAQNHSIDVNDVLLSLAIDSGRVVTGDTTRDYYIDSEGNIYWVISQEAQLVEKI